MGPTEAKKYVECPKRDRRKSSVHFGEVDCDGIDLQWMYENSSEEESDEDNDEKEGGVRVKYFTHELSFKGRLRRFFIGSPTSRNYSTIFDLCAKVTLCILYVVRVCLDDHDTYACYGEPCKTEAEVKGKFTKTTINWHVIVWVHRPMALWIMEVVITVITLAKSFLFVFLAAKGTACDHILTMNFFLEFFCSAPMIVTMVYPPLLQNLYVPLFLNCWLAKHALQRLMNDLHLTKERFQTISVTLNQQICILTVSIFCMIFSTFCGIQHIQRGSSDRPLTLFESIYFVVITMSTVGYGDISPDIWLGQLFTFIMICISFGFIPKQLEHIASTWAQKKKTGGDYAKRKAEREKHVVVCASCFPTEVIMNFLNEFYEHPKLEEHTVILLSSEELDNNMQIILKDPKWANRVLYMKGHPLKDVDLKRCRIHEAEAVFFLVNKNCEDRDKADQHTILKAWAVKDFAPGCRQYIQLFKATNKMHVRFAEHVVCDDEFTYALLANNCLFPGLSTFVTLILHTSRGKEGNWAKEHWQQVYGRHSGNEIYHIQLNRSIFFHSFEGKTFVQASAAVHQSLGVCLIAVLDSSELEPRLKLNPGPDYILKGNDYCFYMSITKEEYSKVTIPKNGKLPTAESTERNQHIDHSASEDFSAELAATFQQLLHAQVDQSESEDDGDESLFNTLTSNLGQTLTKAMHDMHDGAESVPLLNALSISEPGNNRSLADRKTSSEPSSPKSPSHSPSVASSPGSDNLDDGMLDRMYETSPPDRVFQQYGDVGQASFTTGPLPSTMPIGTKRISCHLHKEPRSTCCLKWGLDCEHYTFKNAGDERWDSQLIIASIGECSPAVYNFIIPLRSSYLSLGNLNPIILLVSKEPDSVFLETIAHFPLVFWMKGKLTNLDDLLRAGIRKALHLVICNIGAAHGKGTEHRWEDAGTVVMVQKITRLFPSVNIITEMHESSNMRFMHFQAFDEYTQEISQLEKTLKEKTRSNMPYLFRLPFAAGQVFSSSMIDRLLYQTFVKGYLICFVRLLLGIDAQEHSGHLSSVKVKRATINQFPTYGDLYQGLCSTTGEIPIAIYRTEKRNPSTTEQENLHQSPGSMRKNSSFQPRLFLKTERDNNNLSDLVNDRLKRLELNKDEPYEIKKPPQTLSYVIVNPSPKRRLKNGDIVYVIQPSNMKSVPNKLKWRYAHRNAPVRQLSDPSTGDGNLVRLSRNRVTWSVGSTREALRKSVVCQEGLKAAVQTKERSRCKSDSYALDDKDYVGATPAATGVDGVKC